MKKLKLLLSSALVYGVLATPVYAETYAMVIGIDQYVSGDNLKGAVNDAREINKALRQTGVRNIRVLLNGSASKAAIYNRWKEMVRSSLPGDTLIVTYAGHGGQVPDLNGDEPDRKDEAFLLSNFQEARITAKDNMIIDDEWHRWFAAAEGRQVIFVVDSCNSGTISRGFSQLFPDRFQDIKHVPQKVVPEAKQKVIPYKKRDHVITFSATTENTKIKEVLINGRMHGILSMVFADALSGKADYNKNGQLEKQELERFISIGVKEHNKAQHPQFHPRGISGGMPLLKVAKFKASNKSPLTTTLSSRGGDNLSYTVSGNRFQYLTLYNLTQNGTIQFLWPLDGDGNGRIGKGFNLNLKIDRTFTGRETVVTIVSALPPTNLHRLLKQLDGKRGKGTLQQKMKSLLKGRFDIKKIPQRLAG